MNILVTGHLDHEKGSDYIYSSLIFDEEQTQDIAANLHIDPDDVDGYINNEDYFGEHGNTTTRAYLNSRDPHNLMATVSGEYEYPGVTIEVNETFEHMEDCAEALSLVD